MRVWGCLHAVPAPPRDPVGDPTPRFAPCARRPDLATGPEALSRTMGATLPGAPLPQTAPCPHSTSHPHCKTAAGHPPAPLPVTQALAHWRPFAGRLAGSRVDVFFARWLRRRCSCRPTCVGGAGAAGRAVAGSFGGSACMRPPPLCYPTSCMVSGVRVAVARASASKVVLNSLSLSG